MLELVRRTLNRAIPPAAPVRGPAARAELERLVDELAKADRDRR
jgi:hypothetical protein